MSRAAPDTALEEEGSGDKEPAPASDGKKAESASGDDGRSTPHDDARPEREGATFETAFSSFALAWSARQGQHRFAVGSLSEQVANRVQLIEMDLSGAQSSKGTRDTEEVPAGSGVRFDVKADIEHPFPPTKLQFVPDDSRADILASSGNTLRIWHLDPSLPSGHRPLLTLTNWRNQHQQTPPPLTSFDWSTVNHAKIATSSVDTTITIWNVEREKAETQLIAHDKVVYDIAFEPGGGSDHLFASVGGDGSARLFDQRNLDHSTIVYETQAISPLLRLAWSPSNPNHIATMYLDKSGLVILDIRKPSVAFLELTSHDACVNSIVWAPDEAGKLLCGCDDGSALIWDVKSVPAKTTTAPQKCFEAGSEVQQVIWPAQFSEVGVVLGCSNSVHFVHDA